ncbi:MAG: ABC transporter substrate-binding protein [Chloroflexi bacterium]|nr:ABC transporter substrate-binding protein [Chloroflexota bacterium]
MSEKEIVTQEEMAAIHPRIPAAYEQLQAGKISRREFLRFATLLGMSAALATACSSGTEEPAATTESSTTTTTTTETSSRYGGVLRKAMQLQLIDHPARLSWTEGANIVRQVAEYLTETGADNITRPYLLDRWEANEDVTEWTLHLRQDVTWNNGDQFTADDVLFTFGQWLDPDVGSSMLGLLTYLDGMDSVVKVDDYTVKLMLNSGNIGVPEHLFHYPAIVLHRNFEGDFIQQPVGTGAYTLEEYKEGERAVFKRRPDYWRKAANGDQLPYLDEIIYVSIDKDAGVAALQSGQVDSLYQPRPSDWQALKDNPDLNTYAVSTAQCFVLRMRVDLEPWNDVRVRNALKMCQDRARILQLSYFGEGELSIDAHVAPIHPAFAPKPIPEYDPEGARALLEEWAAETGNTLPLQVTLASKNDEAEPEIAAALKEMAAPAGFDIILDITDPGGFWDRWTEVDLGITAWTHRPLDTMVLPLAYIADADGVPVPWNETRWVDDEFSALVLQAEKTLDVEARRAIMSDIEDIMQTRGPIGNAYWKSVWNITHKKFQGISAHPTSYDLLFEVYIQE